MKTALFLLHKKICNLASKYRFEMSTPGVSKYEPKEIEPLKALVKDISKRTNISVRDICSRKHDRAFSEVRQLYFKRAKELFPGASFRSIGEVINRDHATVIYGIKMVKQTKELRDRYNVLFNNGTLPEPPIEKAFQENGFYIEPTLNQ